MRQRSSQLFRRCFVDTSAYFALADADDQNHGIARRVLEQLARQRIQQFTTNYVVAETHALMVNRLNRSLALTFMQNILAGNTVIVRVRTSDEVRAWQIIETYTDKDFTLTDAISFVVMERLQIRNAFTFKERLILLNINRLYRPTMSETELYEVTRKWWRGSPAKRKPDLALAVYQGIIRAVYRINTSINTNGWEQAPRDSEDYPRWAFTGQVATNRVEEYLWRSVHHLVGKGPNPIKYLNCE